MSWSPKLALVFVLSLAFWSACYFAGSPLNAAETVVVVGLCALFVWLGGAAWARLRKAEEPAPVKKPPATKKRRK